jgi:hypothetical protein
MPDYVDPKSIQILASTLRRLAANNRGVTLRQATVTGVNTTTVDVDPGTGTSVEVDVIGAMPEINDVVWLFELGGGRWLLIQPGGGGGAAEEVVTFSSPSILAVGQVRMTGWFKTNRTLSRVEVRLSYEGTTQSQIMVMVNGVSKGSITIAANAGADATLLTANLTATACTPNDKIELYIQQAGVGAQGITVGVVGV